LESYLIYSLSRLVFSLVRTLPYGTAATLLDSLAALAYRLDTRHRHIARVNLCIAFPELSLQEHDRIAQKSFQSTARNLLEVSRLPLLNRGNISSYVDYDPEFGLNNFEAARSEGKGILYLTGHFSAWELLPTAHALYGHPLSFITRPLDNPHLEQYLRRMREIAGNQVIAKKDSARQILKVLKACGSVGVLMDQNTGLNEGIFADFFGIPAATTTGVALFALRTDAPVLPGYLTPRRNGRYTIKFLPKVNLIRSGDMTRDVQLNTELFNGTIEQIIRQQPESWLWGHKRWKQQPDGNPPDLYRLSRDELLSFLAGRKRRGTFAPGGSDCGQIRPDQKVS